MGGRGASSGATYKWRGKNQTYGDEYTTVLQHRNIKFVKINSGSTTAPMETRTKGRVYVTIANDNHIKSITYYDKNGKRKKQIDLDHIHPIDGKPEKPHVHLGFNHNENGDRVPSKKERRMIDRVKKLWYNHLNPK